MMPTFQVSQENINDFKVHVSEVLQISYQLVEALRFSLIRAWFRPQVDSSGKQKWTHITKSINKAGYLSSYKNIEYEYWEHLEPLFFNLIYKLLDFGRTAGKPMIIYKHWVRDIRHYSLQYFDQYALNEAIDGDDMKRAIEAKNYLWGELYPKRKSLLKEINEFKDQMEDLK